MSTTMKKQAAAVAEAPPPEVDEDEQPLPAWRVNGRFQAHRDMLNELKARVDALEAENTRLKAELAEVRALPAVAGPLRSAQLAREDEERRRKEMQWHADQRAAEEDYVRGRR